MEVLQSGASFHDFDKEPIFVGLLKKEVTREKDGDGEGQKAGDVMGYLFDNKDGEGSIIGNSHAVKKALENCKEGDCVGFEFLGKAQNSKGQPVNRFEIIKFDDFDEAENFYSGDAKAVESETE